MKYYASNEAVDAAKALANHAILALPTDTVYGIGVQYGELEDLERLRTFKHRPETKPIPVLVSDLAMMESIADLNERARKLAQTMLPGALTLVLPRKKSVPSEFTNGKDTIAVRIPDQPFLLDIVRALGKPVMLTSANLSGEEPASSAGQVEKMLPGLDGIALGDCQILKPSTIVDCTSPDLAILRQGSVGKAEIEAALQS